MSEYHHQTITWGEPDPDAEPIRVPPYAAGGEIIDSADLSDSVTGVLLARWDIREDATGYEIHATPLTRWQRASLRCPWLLTLARWLRIRGYR